jgi:Transport and Golgi organisation 2
MPLRANASSGYSLMSMTNAGEDAGICRNWPSNGMSTYWISLPINANPLGEFGFGNSSPDTPFQKVVYGEGKFSKVVNSMDFNVLTEDQILEALLNFAKDTTL